MGQPSARKLVIIGGGAAGFFAALAAAERALRAQTIVDISILESSDSLLKKVKISGGGRCNVTHNCFDVMKFCENYPRGKKELISLMQRFQAQDTVEWFAKRGVKLVAEEDGRMFPDTDTSQTIIDCFLNEAERLNVKIFKNHTVESIEVLSSGSRFCVKVKDRSEFLADSILVATGSSPAGYRIAKDLGHSIADLAPSLFSFKISNSILKDLAGTSFSDAQLSLDVGGKVFKQRGPMLITHWGLSGPAILKLSAWAAREMKRAHYKGNLKVNWLGLQNHEAAFQMLSLLKEKNLKSLVGNVYPTQLTKRFWQNVLQAATESFLTAGSGAAHATNLSNKRYSDISNKELNKISDILFASELLVLGQNRFKDEFVECGGVNLKEVDFKTMESKIQPGLFFAGELLDIDGITGGFNFQNAWSGGWVAAQNM